MLSRIKPSAAESPGPASPAHSEPSAEDIAAAEREELSPVTLMPVPLIKSDTPPPDLQMTPDKYDMIGKYLKAKDESASVYNYQAYFDKTVRKDAKKLREDFKMIRKEYDDRIKENEMAHKLILLQKIQCLNELNEIRASQKKNREARKKREREKEEQRIKEEKMAREVQQQKLQQEQKIREMVLAQQRQQQQQQAAAVAAQQQAMLAQIIGQSQSSVDPLAAIQQLQAQNPSAGSLSTLLQIFSTFEQQRQQQQQQAANQQNMEAYATILRAVQQQQQQQQQLAQLQQATGLDPNLILAHLNTIQQQAAQQQQQQQQKPK